MPLALARSAIFLPTLLAAARLPPVRARPFCLRPSWRKPGSRPSGRRSTGRKYGSTSDTRSAAAARRCPEPSCGYVCERAADSRSSMSGSAFFQSSVVGRRSSAKPQKPIRTTVLHRHQRRSQPFAAWPTTEDQRLTTVISLRSYQPSSSSARRHSVRPCSCTDRAGAGCAFRRRPVRLFGGRCRSR